MENASARNMWGDFLDAHLEYAFVDAPQVIRLRDNKEDANTCVRSIKKGVKKAFSSSLLGLQYRKERLPKTGEFLVITDWEGQAKCLIRLTKVVLKPFFSINAEYTQREGEGDRSLEHWRKVYWDYFTRELEPFGRVPRDSMILVCQEFEKVFER
ncbi:MAG: ASCH domain-containing protein [Bacteroidota bacterium]